MSAKRTILILCDWFLPGYLAGGPIQSIATLTEQLHNDVDFKIISTDRDFKAEVPYQNIKINEWTQFDGRTVFYVSPENMNETFLLNLIKQTPHDTLYLNSLFSKHFSINPLKWKSKNLIHSKIVLASRGMLGDGALAVKPLKKKLFLLYAKFSALYKDIHWQSTSKEETSQIKKHIGSDVNLVQVSNFPAVSKQKIKLEKVSGTLKLCFIARILEVKNLHFAIQILKDIKDYTIVFDVFGPIEDKLYWDKCLQSSKLLPSNIQLHYKGILVPVKISETISNYHALFLPTHTENFGHIIVETFQSYRPVIISDQTPWRNLELVSAGFDFSLNDKSKFVNAVEQLGKLNQKEFDDMCESSKSFIDNALNIKEIRAQYINLFNL